MQAVKAVWDQGGVVIAVSDGSLVQGGTVGPADAPVEVEERMACGWVLTAGPPDSELTGSEVEPAPPLVATGGFRLAGGAGVASSYVAELAGALDVMRCMMECVGEEQRAGTVHHWCDNAGVVELIGLLGEMPPRYWRSKPCRDMWAEMQGRMSWWRSHGGEWETRWVKGHVDRDGTRAPYSYTIADEQLNIAADGVAGWAGGLTERKAGAQGHQNGRQEAGGEWRACGAADPYWGAVAPFILDMASQRAAREYWAARQHNREDGLQWCGIRGYRRLWVGPGGVDGHSTCSERSYGGTTCHRRRC